jgi:hypothetical protein
MEQLRGVAFEEILPLKQCQMQDFLENRDR